MTPGGQNAKQARLSASKGTAALKTSLVIVAAGRGLRLGGGEPKAYRACAGKPLLARTLEALHAAHDFSDIIVVIHADDQVHYDTTLANLAPELTARLAAPAFGGATRQQSVLAGLEVLAARAPDLVLIHDAARPFVSRELVERAVHVAARGGAAIPALRLSDSVKAVDAHGGITGAPARESLRVVQTPQAFRFAEILAAHRGAAAAGIDHLTDDAEVAAWAGQAVFTFEGDPANVKVTTQEDLRAAEARLFAQKLDVRVGQGFDVHAFTSGDHVMLCGVRIAHGQALLGHSDADVALHAVADAIYGALGLGDIGDHFPPSDARWRGADSAIFVAHAAAQLRARGGVLANVDVTLICEAPKIAAHRAAMRAALARMLGIGVERIGVKATTSEGLGFTGRGEGIACLASATVRLP